MVDNSKSKSGTCGRGDEDKSRWLHDMKRVMTIPPSITNQQRTNIKIREHTFTTEEGDDWGGAFC